MDQWRQRLRDGVAEFDLDHPERCVATLSTFAEALVRWNRVYNLTAITDLSRVVTHHLLDSLSVLPYLRANPALHDLLDLGSGGGLPGIPIALCAPDRRVTLLDKSAKKTRFLTQMCADLGLANVVVKSGRIETIDECFDAIVCRAFGSLETIESLALPRLNGGGVVLAMRGRVTGDEIDAIGSSREVLPLNVPFVEEDRNLVVIHRE